MLKKSLLLAVLMVGAASVGVLAAQHLRSGESVSKMAPEMQFIHHACSTSGHGQSTNSHVPDALAKVLELTAAQQTEIDRLAADACAQMAKIHASIHSVLTPEQQAKLKELHGGDHGAEGIHAIMKRLHGGK